MPNTPGKSFLTAFLAALTDPLLLLISVAYGNPMPSPEMLGHLFGPTVFAVILATFLSRLIFRMGKDIQEARRMGSYRLVEKLGKGGMREVWLAQHQMLARPAEVKRQQTQEPTSTRWDEWPTGCSAGNSFLPVSIRCK